MARSDLRPNAAPVGAILGNDIVSKNLPAEKWERLPWIDVARGLSILLVVLFHASISLNNAGLLHPFYWTVNDLFSPIRMPVFFAISGVLIAKHLDKPLIILARQRTVLLWYLYCIWLLIHEIVISSIGPRIFDLEVIATSLVIPNPVLWFIWAMGFYVIASRIVPYGGRFMALIAAITVSLMVKTGFISLGSSALDKTLVYLWVYLLGAWHPQMLKNLALRPVAVGISTGIMFIVLFFALRKGVAWDGFRVPLAFAGIALGFSASVAITQIRFVSEIFQFFGRNTLAIYVAHSPLLIFSTMLITKLGLEDVAGANVWTVLVSICLVVAASLLLRTFCERAGLWFLYSAPSQLEHGLGSGHARATSRRWLRWRF